MKAMVFTGTGKPLVFSEVEAPRPGDDQVLIRVAACAVCRTDLHIVDGELDEAEAAAHPGAPNRRRGRREGRARGPLPRGDRVGVPWRGWTDGTCKFCRSDRENLCDHARFIGYQIDGGYAEFAVADARYCFPIADLPRRRRGSLRRPSAVPRRAALRGADLKRAAC